MAHIVRKIFLPICQVRYSIGYLSFHVRFILDNIWCRNSSAFMSLSISNCFFLILTYVTVVDVRLFVMIISISHRYRITQIYSSFLYCMVYFQTETDFQACAISQQVILMHLVLCSKGLQKKLKWRMRLT